MKSCFCYFSKICGIFHTPTVTIRELTDAGMALQEAVSSGCIRINLEDISKAALMSRLRLLPANKDFYGTAALCSLVNDRLMSMTYSKQVFLHWQCPDWRYKNITKKTCPNNLSLLLYSLVLCSKNCTSLIFMSGIWESQCILWVLQRESWEQLYLPFQVGVWWRNIQNKQQEEGRTFNSQLSVSRLLKQLHKIEYLYIYIDRVIYI